MSRTVVRVKGSLYGDPVGLGKLVCEIIKASAARRVIRVEEGADFSALSTNCGGAQCPQCTCVACGESEVVEYYTRRRARASSRAVIVYECIPCGATWAEAGL